MFAQKLGLTIDKSDKLLQIEATGGGYAPYLGHIEVNLKIPEIKAFNEDVLMQVIEDSNYGQRVPVQVAPLHINRPIELISDDELNSLSTHWKRG